MPEYPSTCEACGHFETAAPAYTVKGHKILRCSGCATMRCEVTDQDFPQIYTEEYFQGGVPDGYFDYHGSEQLLHKEYRHRLELIRSHCPSGRLLEVGCATGGFLQMASRNYEVQGIDISDFAVTQARAKALNVQRGTLLESEIDPKVDAVAMFDTIEHLPSPKAAIERAFKVLNHGGIIVLSTGEVTSLLSLLMGRYWRLMTPPQHLWFFSRKGIERLLERAGFEIISVKYPSRWVPVSLIWYQAFRGGFRPLPRRLGNLVLPINLFDSMTVIARRPAVLATQP